MKEFKEYISEKLELNKDSNFKEADPFTVRAQEKITKYLGLKYSDGAGQGGPYKCDGDKGKGTYFERGAIEGQDKVFCSVYNSLDSKKPVIQIYTTTRSNSNTMKTVAFYGVNCKDDYVDVIHKCWPDAKLYMCKDIDDMITNIRNDWGRVSSYRNIGHEYVDTKTDIIYTFSDRP